MQFHRVLGFSPFLAEDIHRWQKLCLFIGCKPFITLRDLLPGLDDYIDEERALLLELWPGNMYMAGAKQWYIEMYKYLKIKKEIYSDSKNDRLDRAERRERLEQLAWGL